MIIIDNFAVASSAERFFQGGKSDKEIITEKIFTKIIVKGMSVGICEYW